ncbi:hypothetical protein BRARA_C01266 [Brassica rapa]|uniref:Uncharacterized protein n=1 Tax=Brassica campestris TaxID=3711 RepID=A0A398A1Y2_BRACM|nr:hypothetical protein BRARA_C01266 [Brassica rapa]
MRQKKSVSSFKIKKNESKKSRARTKYHSRKIILEEEKALAENEPHMTLSSLEEAKTKAENLKNQAHDIQKPLCRDHRDPRSERFQEECLKPLHVFFYS